jgi:hypothetical protein
LGLVEQEQQEAQQDLMVEIVLGLTVQIQSLALKALANTATTEPPLVARQQVAI